MLRQTMRKRLRNKLQAVKAELRERLHHSVPEVGRWLHAVVRGHYAYYAVPNNQAATQAFRNQVLCLWHRALQRRSQKSVTTWRRTYLLAKRWLPSTRVHHPWPEQRLCVNT